MNEITFKDLFSNPNLVFLIIDENGIIRDVSPNAKKMIGFDKTYFHGKRLEQIFSQRSSFEKQILTIACIKEHAICPGYVYVGLRGKGTHNAIEDVFVDKIFHFSYFSWVNKNSAKFLPISLAPQHVTLESPIVQWLTSLYRQVQQPLVLLDNDFRIFFYNSSFLSLLNYYDDSKILGFPILEFLDERHRNPSPFDFLKKIRDPVGAISKDVKHQWKPMVTVPLKNGSAKKAVNRLFVKNKRLKLKCSNGALKIRENQADPAEPSRLIFSKAVNFPNRDLKVEISFIAEKGIDVTIALGRPVSGGLYRFFDHGYHIDIKFHNHLFCQFSRRSSPLLRSEIEHITPGTTCAITIKRIGPVISIEMNGRIIMHYKDPRPIIGVFASHLYLYCWGHALELRKFAISIKTSKYNRETEEHDRSKFISFATVPGKLFNFYTEQIYCINRVAFVVGFNELPILSRNPGKDTLLSRLEEVRNHIESNYFRKTDFKKLAGMCCISYVHFINKFKEVYGSAPKSFQIECKLREAEKLLKSGKYQIKEVGEMIGFEDVVNFHHFIKKHRHTTPGYMREKPV